MNTRSPASTLERAQIGHGDPSAGHDDVGQRLAQQRASPTRSVPGIDGAERREPDKELARIDPPQLIGRAQRLGDADRVDLVSRLARTQQKDAHALAQ